MSVDAFLVSMQAAGAIADTYGTSQQIAMGRAGARVEQSQLNTRLEEERTAAAFSAVDAMIQLRQTLATQRVMFAARGQRAGAGSALAIGTESVRNEANDTRVRRMNLLTRESSLRSAGVLSGLHQLSSESKLGQQLSQRLWDQAPVSEFGKTASKNWKERSSRKTVEGV